MHAGASAASIHNATQASRKKIGGSHRQSLQSNPSHAQFAASKRGPSGGAKTPQINSLMNTNQTTSINKQSRLKGMTGQQ